MKWNAVWNFLTNFDLSVGVLTAKPHTDVTELSALHSYNSLLKMGSLFICLVVALCLVTHVIATSKIEHFIVLMLENRSFDHMLGFLKNLQPTLNGSSLRVLCSTNLALC